MNLLTTVSNSSQSAAPTEGISNYALGSISTIAIIFITQLIIYLFNKSEANRSRQESFKLKLFELKLQASQTAYQYVLKTYRAYKVPGYHNDPEELNHEARDWLDGQALLLGDHAYETVIYYLFALDNNTLSDQEHAKQLVKAETALKSIIKNIKKASGGSL